MFYIILFVLLALSVTAWSLIARDHFLGGYLSFMLRKAVAIGT